MKKRRLVGPPGHADTSIEKRKHNQANQGQNQIYFDKLQNEYYYYIYLPKKDCFVVNFPKFND